MKSIIHYASGASNIQYRRTLKFIKDSRGTNDNYKADLDPNFLNSQHHLNYWYNSEISQINLVFGCKWSFIWSITLYFLIILFSGGGGRINWAKEYLYEKRFSPPLCCSRVPVLVNT